jgi:hypothetical protein
LLSIEKPLLPPRLDQPSTLKSSGDTDAALTRAICAFVSGAHRHGALSLGLGAGDGAGGTGSGVKLSGAGAFAGSDADDGAAEADAWAR